MSAELMVIFALVAVIGVLLWRWPVPPTEIHTHTHIWNKPAPTEFDEADYWKEQDESRGDL